MLSPSSDWISPMHIKEVVTPCHKGSGATLPGLSQHHGLPCGACPWKTSVMQNHGHHHVPFPGFTGRPLPLPIRWPWSCCPTLLFPLNEVCVGVPRDLVGMSHPVLEAPVSKNEIEP